MVRSTYMTIGFLPFSHLFPIGDIGTMGFVVNTVKLPHILINVSFRNAGQSDFQNVNLFILAVYPALQFAFLGISRKTFQVVTLKFPSIAFLFCRKDDFILSITPAAKCRNNITKIIYSTANGIPFPNSNIRLL